MVINLAPSASSSAMATIPVLGLQGFNRIPYYINLAAALEQTLGGKADAIFGDHSEHDECRLRTKTLYQFIRMTAFEDVEGLLLQQDLLVLREILRQGGGGFVRDRSTRSVSASGTKSEPGVPLTQCGGKIANSGSSGT